MNAVRRILGLFQDSPTYGRDKANMASGLTIGAAALLLNGVVLMMVLPLMLAPDDRDFRPLTENIEFGQLLALILLGGATGFATLLIPFRLSTVLMGPRVGRYFDQIVLSGISPIRFLIGKVTSQNLFLGLTLFLLLPYLVLSIALGGLDLVSFLTGIFLVWLHCMALALATIWLSLYLNEILAAVIVVAATMFLGGLGCAPFPFQPFVMTPMPALMHPVYSAMPSMQEYLSTDYWTLVIACSATSTCIILVSLFAIYIGPLYGIIQENSTFGEVVRAGDSKRKRWLRIRHHVQRPSELAFFYENRSDTLRRCEGLVRWGFGFGFMTLLSGSASVIFVYGLAILIGKWGPPGGSWVYAFHGIYLTIHGIGLLLAACIFSHAKNCTYMKLPFFRGRRAEVSKLDTTCFLVFAAISTALAIATPYCFEQYFSTANTDSVFPDPFNGRYQAVDFVRIVFEGTAVITIAGLVVYCLHRFVCLATWLKSVALLITTAFYVFLFCFVPFFPALLLMEIRELKAVQWFANLVPTVSMASPFTVMGQLYNELGPRFPAGTSTVPFYVLHGSALMLILLGTRLTGRKLRKQYLAQPVEDKP